MKALLLLFLVVFIFTLVIFSLAILIRLRDSFFIKIPFVSTRERAIGTIVKALSLSKGSVFYELGCGNGKILQRAITETSGSRGVGFEKGYLPYLLSLWNTKKLPVTIYYQDILSVDLSPATHIYCYLFDFMMEKLSPKILRECKKGTRIVTCDFQLPGIPLVQTVSLEAGNEKLSKMIYVYEVR